jgi:hypothetical protein
MVSTRELFTLWVSAIDEAVSVIIDTVLAVLRPAGAGRISGAVGIGTVYQAVRVLVRPAGTDFYASPAAGRIA